LAKGGILQTAWVNNNPALGYHKGEGNWRLNFFTVDLALGRNTFVSSKIAAHPFLALRGVFVNEHDASKLSFEEGATPAVLGDAKFKSKGRNNFWGVGPRIGTDFTYYMQPTWTLLGSFSGSVLLGSYGVHEEMTLFRSIVPRTNKFTAKDSGFAIRGNLEGSIGLGWEKWFKHRTVRLAPSFVFEAAQWYDMNQRMSLGDLNSAEPTNNQIGRRHGDLTLWGFNFNLQVDF
jgi:hypothetical protein